MYTFQSSALPGARESTKAELGRRESTGNWGLFVDASRVLHPGQGRTGPVHATVGAGQP